jgi:hypothetical protein
MVARANAPSKLTAIQRTMRKIFVIGPALRGECFVPSIVAKTGALRKPDLG